MEKATSVKTPAHKTTTQNAAPDSAPRSFLGSCVRAAPWFALFTFAACLPTWLGLGARWYWLLDLTTHFTWHYAAGLPLLAILCGVRRRPWLAVLVLVTLGVDLWRLAPLYVSPSPPAAQGAQLRVLTQNVLKKNDSHTKVLELIQRESPDLVLLMEVNQQWLDALKALESTHPYHAAQLKGTRSGVAFYSRVPLDALEFRNFGQADRYSSVARLQLGKRQVTVVGVHATLPKRARGTALRDEDLMAAGQFIAQQSGTALLMGDFNTTPWSPVFGDLLRTSGLQDSMRGFGAQASWGPNGWGRVVLPIDHVLHSSDFRVIDRRIGPDVGSDHRAVIVDFAIVD